MSQLLLEKPRTKTKRKPRGVMEFIVDILRAAAQCMKFDFKKRIYRGMTNIKLYYLNNRSYNSILDYVVICCEKGLLKVVEFGGQKEYLLTRKGADFLDSASNLFGVVGMDEYSINKESSTTCCD